MEKIDEKQQQELCNTDVEDVQGQELKAPDLIKRQIEKHQFPRRPLTASATVKKAQIGSKQTGNWQQRYDRLEQPLHWKKKDLDYALSFIHNFLNDGIIGINDKPTQFRADQYPYANMRIRIQKKFINIEDDKQFKSQLQTLYNDSKHNDEDIKNFIAYLIKKDAFFEFCLMQKNASFLKNKPVYPEFRYYIAAGNLWQLEEEIKNVKWTNDKIGSCNNETVQMKSYGDYNCDVMMSIFLDFLGSEMNITNWVEHVANNHAPAVPAINYYHEMLYNIIAKIFINNSKSLYVKITI